MAKVIDVVSDLIWLDNLDGGSETGLLLLSPMQTITSEGPWVDWGNEVLDQHA